jgi:hypothetical protein
MRWNSVAEMISRALALKPVLYDLCDQAQFNKREGVRLCRYIFQDDEWYLLEQLWPLLNVCFTFNSFEYHVDHGHQVFLFITKEVSKSAIPHIHQVIPFMDGLFDTLDDYASDRNKLPAV